jgi:hypothetical protein
VRTIDRWTKDGEVVSETVSERVLTPADGVVSMHCTTSRTLEIVDLAYDDPRVTAQQTEQAA